MIYRMMYGVAAVALMLGALGASCNLSPNVYTPLTGTTSIAIINTTPYRAVFTVGAYDNLDQNSVPQASTSLLESQANDPTGMGVLTGLLTPTCRRAISIGSQELLDLINKQSITVSNKKALVVGANFSDAAVDSPDATNPTQGTALPLTVLQGVDYPCNSLVIFRMEQDATATGGFKIVLDGVIF